MSGGGNHVARGGMSAKLAREAVPADVLREWENEESNDARALEEAQRKYQSASAEVEQLKRSLPELDTEIEKAKMDVETGKRRIADAQKRLKDLKCVPHSISILNIVLIPITELKRDHRSRKSMRWIRSKLRSMT
jgi:structural maintenance of chromosome 4